MSSRRLVLGLLSAGLVLACQKPSSTQATPGSNAPVAKWSGGVITAGELDAVTYEQRKAALDQLLVRKLVEQKAKELNVSPEEYIKHEVADKVRPPAPAEVKAFYDEQSKRQPLPPFEQVKEQITQYLQRQGQQAVQQQLIEQLKVEAGAQIMLLPPKVNVAAEGPAKGPANAPVTIVEFSDFQCPFCARAEEAVTKVLQVYGPKIRLVFRDFPLPFHQQAGKAAEAAHCAEDQGKYWEMHGKLFANQKALDVPSLKGYAKELGLDAGKFDKCLESGSKADVVAKNRKAGEAVGVQGTPAFFINGYLLSGAQPFDEFKKIIDAELKK